MGCSRSAQSDCSFQCFEWGEPSCYSAVLQPFHQHGGAYHFSGLAESSLSFFPTWQGGVLSRFFPHNDTVNSKSVMGIKPGDSVVCLDIRLMNLLTPWLAEHLTNQSHIYTGLTGKVSTLTHFTL